MAKVIAASRYSPVKQVKFVVNSKTQNRPTNREQALGKRGVEELEDRRKKRHKTEGSETRTRYETSKVGGDKMHHSSGKERTRDNHSGEKSAHKSKDERRKKLLKEGKEKSLDERRARLKSAIRGKKMHPDK